MYRRVVTKLREAGVTNAVFVWNMMGHYGWRDYYDALYPGDAYVDWMAYDPYITDESRADVFGLINFTVPKLNWPGYYAWATAKAILEQSMPEGHTIHRIARDHGRLLVGRTIRVSSPQGRFADADRVDGAVLERIQPYGKHLFYEWSTGEVGHVHLGLFGKFRVQTTDSSPDPIGEVRMRLQTEPDEQRDEYVTIDLSGPTACSIDPPSVRTDILARLGPDPIRRGSTPDRMIDKMLRSKRGIGDLLMDQSVVCGVGNVYRAEALFVCGIHPLRPGADCDPAELLALWATIQGMLRQGVKDGRIVTVSRADLGIASNHRIRRRRGDLRVQARPVPAVRRCHRPHRDRQPHLLLLSDSPTFVRPTEPVRPIAAATAPPRSGLRWVDDRSGPDPRHRR